jgi:hypothetical protein
MIGGESMSKTRKTWISALVVGAMLLSAFPYFVSGDSSTTAHSTNDTIDLPAGGGSYDTPTGVGQEDPVPWYKIAAPLRAGAKVPGKVMVEVTIFTEDMAELAPVLQKWDARKYADLVQERDGRSPREGSPFRAPKDVGFMSTPRVVVPEAALAEIASLPGVLGIEMPENNAPAVYKSLETEDIREKILKYKNGELDLPEMPEPTEWGTIVAQQADAVWNDPNLGYTGDGVYVAVQDWGVDFAHPNLLGRWATVTDPASPYFGWPIMWHSYSMDLIMGMFTSGSDWDRYPYPIFASFAEVSWYSDTTYQCQVDPLGYVNYTFSDECTPGIWQNTKRINPDGLGAPANLNRISRSYYVGDITDPARINSASGWYHLGVAKDDTLTSIFGERVGILVTDSTTPFVYDTVYVDLNFDFDFTNDKPITQADPIAGWDIDMDGFYDISGGLLYFIANTTGSATGETVIAAATGTETTASLAGDHVVTDIQGYDALVSLVLYQDGVYWPSSTETIYETVIADTTGLGDETGTTAQLTAGANINTGAAVDTATLLADYDLSFVYDIYNSTASLVEGTDYTIDLSTGLITWLVDFPDGDFVDIIYQFDTWTVDFTTGELTFSAPPIAGAAVTADYDSGLSIPYSDVYTAQYGYDNFIPASGDMVAFHGAFETYDDHGTLVSTSLAGNPVGNFFGIFDVWGPAPDVKIIGVEVPTAPSTLDLFYFSATGYDGIPGTGDEANIATNSWGSTRDLRSGFEPRERAFYDIMTNLAPDFSILFASGNNGPGYATVGPPGTGPGVITVGAGTNMNYRWLFGYDGGDCYYDWIIVTGQCGEPANGDIADFSSRGPTLLGTPEPDVFSVGAFAIGGVPLNIGCLSWGCGGLDAWDLWSGTSLATPVTSSVMALVYEAYKDANGVWPSSADAKALLMSTADDHGFDVLQQGAGWTDAYRAAYAASGQGGVISDTPFWNPGGYEGVNRPGFINFVTPGTPEVGTIQLTNTGPNPEALAITGVMYDKIAPDYSFTWSNSAPWPGRDWRILKPDGLYDGDGITQLDATDISAGWNNADFIRITFERDPAILGDDPYTYIELMDWFNYARDDYDYIVESTVTSVTNDVLVVGFLGETKGYTANAPVLPGTYTFYRNAVPMTEGVDYTFDPATGLVTLLGGPLADGEILSGDYDWYVPVLAGSSYPLSWTYIVPGSEVVYLNGSVWDSASGANWTIDFLNGIFNLWVDLTPGDYVEIDYTYDLPTFDDFDERNRFGFYGIVPNNNIVNAQIYDPANRVHDGLAISFRDINDVLGPTQVTVEFYGSVTWPWLTLSTNTMNLAGGANGNFTATMSVPVGTQAGSYQGAIKYSDGTNTTTIPILVNILYSGFPAFFGGGTPTTTLYDPNGFIAGEKPSASSWRQTGDSRIFWADVGTLVAGDETPLALGNNRQMIFDLFWAREESDVDMEVFYQVPDSTWTDDAIYGPSTFAELATTKEQDRNSDTIRNDAEILKAAMTSGILGIYYRANTATEYPQETFTADIGYMQTDPIVLDIQTNQLAGSRPVAVTANVDLVDGIGAAVTETISDVQSGVWVDPYPYPGGSFLQYLYDTRFVAPDSVHMTFVPTGTISAAWTISFYGSASDIDVGIFREAATDPASCTGAYTIADDVMGTAMATGNNPESGSLKFPEAGCYWVHLAGYTVGAPGPQADIAFDVLKIGAGAFSAANVATVTVPANTPATFDIAWDFPGSTPEGTQTSALLVSPGYAPFALVQPIDILFSYDLTPPTLAGEAPADGSIVNDLDAFMLAGGVQVGIFDSGGGLDPATAQMWFDGVDVSDAASVSAAYDSGVGGPTTGAIAYLPPEPPANGQHTVVAMMGDVAGNMATLVWSFTIDTAAPSLTLTSPADGLITTSATVTVAGVTDPGATVSIGGATQAADTVDGSFSGIYTLDEGANTIVVTSTDDQGNMASTSVTVTLDSTVPAISSIKNSAGSVTNMDSTTLSGTVDPDARLWINGQEVVVNADGSWSATVTLAEGLNTITIVATDGAGNSASTDVTVTRDTAPPLITLGTFPTLIQEREACDRSADATEGYLCYVTISGSVDDPDAAVFINGKFVGVGTFSEEFGLNYGPNDFTVTSNDTAGNIEQVSTSISFTPRAFQITRTYTTVILMALAVILLIIGLVIGFMVRGKPGAPPEEEIPPEEEEPEEEEEMVPPAPEEEEMPPAPEEVIEEEEEDLFELEELEDEAPPPPEEPPEGGPTEEGEEL